MSLELVSCTASQNLRPEREVKKITGLESNKEEEIHPGRAATEVSTELTSLATTRPVFAALLG